MWNVARLNCPSPVYIYRRVIWYATSPFPSCDDMFHCSVGCLSAYHMQQLSPTPVLALSVPKPHDKVNSGKLHQTFKRICDLTTRPAAKKKGLDQRFYDTLKNIAHQLEISTGISECGSHVQFNPPCSGTICTLFFPKQPAITSVSMPPNSEARPQTVRKRSRHEPHKTPASLCPSINSSIPL